MKYLYYFTFLILLHCQSIGYSQSTQDLFSIPGLAFVIDEYDDTGFFTEASLYYMGDTIHQDTLYHRYENKSRSPFYLYIDQQKVYIKSLEGQSKKLQFDFGLEVGDVIVKNEFEYVLESKEIIQLEDGLDRIALNFIGLENPNWKTRTIEGIGYEKQGLLISPFPLSYKVLQCVSSDNGQILLKDEITFDECDSRSCPGIETSFIVDGEKENISITHESYNFDSISLTFGDGQYFDDFVDSYTYDEEGCYKIELEIFNSCGGSAYYHKYYDYCEDPKWKRQSDIALRRVHFVNQDLGYGISWDKYYETNDGGMNWIEKPLPESEEDYSLTNIYYSDAQNGVIATSANTEKLAVIVTSDGGNTWTGILGEEDLDFTNVAMNDDGDIFAVKRGAVYRTRDNGVNWTKLNIPNGYLHADFQLTESGALIFAQLKFSSADFPSFLYISNDDGESWKEVDMTFDRNISSVYFFDANQGFVGMYGDLYKTTDGGDTWENIYSPKEEGSIHNLHFIDQNLGVLVKGKSLFTTQDGGETWQIEYCQNTELIYDVVTVGDQYFAAMNNGFYKRKLDPDFDCDAINTTVSQQKLDVEIAPNPTTNYIHIIGSERGVYHVEIRDVKGAIQESKNIANNEPIDVSSLSTGMYLVSIQKDGIRQTFKLVKH